MGAPVPRGEHLEVAQAARLRARRLGAAAAAVAVLAAGLSLGSGTAVERDPRWNVVVIITDDQTLDSLPHDPPVMPFLQAAATDRRDHWIVFPNFFANTPLCCPSRATMLTGRYAHETGVVNNDSAVRLDERATIAAWLHEAGYHTGLVGKYLNEYPFGREAFVPFGWDRWWGKAQGAVDTLYHDYTLIQQGVPTAYGSGPGDYSTDVLAGAAVSFLRDAPLDRPFFLWFAPTAPHPPWIPAPRDAGADARMRVPVPASVDEADVSDKPAWVRALPPLGPAARAGLAEAHRRSFEALLAVDDAVREIVGALRERGDLERTVIVFVSDNGFSFGEHRWVTKTCPYEECTHVPFLVRYPPAGHGVERALASTVDLAPTIAELAGIRPPTATSGTSLVPLLDGRSDVGSGRVLLEWIGGERVPGWREVRTARFAYVELETDERELYDLRGDPGELENVAEDPAYAAAVRRLSAVLRRSRGS